MHLNIIIFVGSRPEVCNITPRWKDELITETDVWKMGFQNPHLPRPQLREGRNTETTRRRLLTFLPPVLMRRGVRKGSKIIWLVSMLTGDCRFPTEQRFQAEFTNPQKEGTRSKKKL